MSKVLFNKTIEFYKLGQEADMISEEEAYNQIVKEDLPATRNLYAILSWFKRWGDKDFFKIEDWLPQFGRIADEDMYATNLFDLIMSGKFGKYTNTIMIFLLERLIKSEPIWFGVKEYLRYEKDYVPANLLRKAQMLLIKTWMEDFKDAEEEQEDAPNEHVEGAFNEVKKDIARLIGELMDQSKKLSPQFLMNLAKHFGVETYIGALNESRGLHGAKTENKEKYSKYDIAYLFSSYIRSINKDRFLQIINKATDQAKEYMRGYLYEDTNHMGDPSALFMLSEDMTPMNIDYKAISWPEGIRILTLDELKPYPGFTLPPDKEQIRNRWAQIFQEFHIIPSVG